MSDLNDAVVIDSGSSASRANIVLDASKLDLFQLCPTRYHYRYNLKRSLPIIQKSRNLDYGSLMHEGYEVYYKALQQGASFKDRLDAAILRINTAACDVAQSNVEPEEAKVLTSVIEQNLDYWRFDDEHMDILEVEAPFAYELFSDDKVRIIVTGKIDLLVNTHGVGGTSSYTNLPIDHKTYQRDFPVYRLSNQFMNYTSAVRSYYMVINRIGLQKTLKPEEKFKRLMLSYDPEILNDWKQNVVNVILDQYAECLATGKWPMNFTSCFKFNRLCEYFQVCDSSGQAAKDFKLESEYVEAEEWDVTKKLGEL